MECAVTLYRVSYSNTVTLYFIPDNKLNYCFIPKIIAEIYKNMPHSKKKKHPEHRPVPQIKKDIKKYRVIAVAIIFFLLFGAGIAFFAAGNNYTWLITGSLAGAVCGYFFGKQIVKELFKK
jgi:hypothetical protein